MLTGVQYVLTSSTSFVCQTHPGSLIIPHGPTAHANSNIRFAHTEELCLFCEVTRIEQALMQEIIGTVEEAYLMDICNRTTNSINDTAMGILTHLQDNYGQLMPHELLEREEIVKKTIYNLHDPIATVFSAAEELLEFSDITGTSYTQLQVVNIS